MDLIVLGVVGASIAIFAMIDLALRSYTNKVRLIWYPIVILVPVIGALAYYLVRKSLPTR